VNQSRSPRTVWADLSTETRCRAVAEFIVHALLVAAAFRSLSKHDVDDLRGSKSLWKGIIPASIVNIRQGTAWVIPVGPILYFSIGRRRRNPAGRSD
jgi:hypothetical protein